MTGDVLRKKYIMLTNLTSYVHKGAVDFFVLRDVRSYVFGRWCSRHSQFSLPLPSDLAISTSFPRQFWFWKCRTIQNQKLTKVEKGVEDKLVLYLILDSFIVSVASDLHKLNNQSEGVSCNRVLRYLFWVLT